MDNTPSIPRTYWRRLWFCAVQDLRGHNLGAIETLMGIIATVFGGLSAFFEKGAHGPFFWIAIGLAAMVGLLAACVTFHAGNLSFFQLRSIREIESAIASGMSHRGELMVAWRERNGEVYVAAQQHCIDWERKTLPPLLEKHRSLLDPLEDQDLHTMEADPDSWPGPAMWVPRIDGHCSRLA